MTAASAEVVIALSPHSPTLTSSGAQPLWANLPDADRVASGLSLTPEQPYRWVAEPGERITVTLKSDAPSGRVLLTVWSWTRDPVAEQAFATPCSETVHFDVGGRGTYLLTLDLVDGDRCVARLARSFSVCPSNVGRREAWRTGQFQVGTCSFPGRQRWANDFGPAHPPGLDEQATRELDADLSARLGMTLVRPDLPASWAGPDQPMDFALADRCIDCFVSRGFRLVLQMGFPYEQTGWTLMPQYSEGPDPRWRYPRLESVVRPWVEAVAARYGKYADYIEVYNEPDNLDFWRGTTEEFIATHHWTAESVRKAAPGVPIISGGLCLMEPERTGLIAAGIHGIADAVGYHSHGGVAELQATLTAMRAVHAAAGYVNPTFINTEMGYANWRLDMERASAASAVQKLIYCWAHGNRAALLYCSRDVGGPRMSAGDWGYLDYFMCPRFTYGAVAAFMDHFAGAVFDRILTERNGLHAYVFRSGDRWLVPFFVAQDFPRPVAFETDASSVQLIDPMGNAEDLPVADGRLALTADFYPQTLVLQGASRVAVEP